MILLFVLSIPFLLPFEAIAEKRTARRKHALVATWPCGWCVAPLGPEALVRAGALFAAYANEAVAEFAPSKTFTKFDTPQARIIQNLHACCPRCDAGHRYDKPSNRFGEDAVATTVVTDLHVRYAAERDGDELCREMVDHGVSASGEGGTSPA